MKSALRLHALLLFGCAALVGCGGGGGSSPASSPGSSGSGSTPSTITPTSTSSATSPSNTTQSTNVPQSTMANVQPVTVGVSPGNTRNMLTTSVTVCEAGTSHCATIDNIQVDTGSNGLRILASALPTTLSLPAITAGSGASAECAVFGSGYAWGAIRTADVRMAGQQASSIPIQVIADTALPAAPTDCANSGASLLTVSSLHSNGILGVGLFPVDCGSGCSSSALPRWYYSCSTSGCTATAQPLAQQVTNPVSSFPIDNNGVVIDLPAVADAGAASASGSLIFGIGTQANNTLTSTNVLKANSATGYVTTTSGGQTYAVSYLDSGSNGLFFHSTQFPLCGFWYCPTSTLSASASITGIDGASSTVSFDIGNSSTLFASSNNAFDNLAGNASQGFGWGLPFFYGKRIYTAIAARDTSAGQGPYYAF
ncbi:DUF3443 domain-containing protein [Paraburkholderia sprentiae WSM5005]|uniref:DUF3443 domain-containing protein n=1 Tax=Paraburkholderia sprentiae WSM5005 TaxID=754502 RepID=A0A1I9YDK7_9BURK|nr:DUF3443 domain-containing protein [Paraburkholderia sprentiae]APA84390.1 DUF3443 domain-containing protein [Paraburkholderia sprentiae WSM5005]